MSHGEKDALIRESLIRPIGIQPIGSPECEGWRYFRFGSAKAMM